MKNLWPIFKAYQMLKFFSEYLNAMLRQKKNHKKPMKEATPDGNSVIKNARNSSNFKVMGDLHQSLTFRRVLGLATPRRERRWLLVVDAKTL